MPERRVPRRRTRDRDAPQQLKHPPALHAAPRRVQRVPGRGAKLPDGADARGVQPRLHVLADAAQVAQFQPVQHARQIFLRDHRQPVRLLHVARGLREKDIRRNPNGTPQAHADFLRDDRLDPPRHRQRLVPLPQPSGQLARHFVDGHDVFLPHLDARVDGREQRVVILDVALVPRLDDPQAGAHPLRVAHARARFHAEFFRLVARGDGAGAVHIHRHHGDRQAAQARLHLLLHRGEVGIEINDHPGERHSVSMNTSRRARFGQPRRPDPRKFSAGSAHLRAFKHLTVRRLVWKFRPT